MIIISYDIHDDLLRNRFAKMITKHGAIRLQYSVYEIRNSKRVLDNIRIKIEHYFSPLFSGTDSVMLFSVEDNNIEKYGNAIHRDKDLLIL